MNGDSINCVLLPVSGGLIMLPNAAVASMISFTQPQAMNQMPAWILGRIPWQGWGLPLISWAALDEPDERESFENARIAVIKSLDSSRRIPYFAVLTQGFPRLVTVTENDLPAVDEDPFADSEQHEARPEHLLARLEWGGRRTDLPDLPKLSTLVTDHFVRDR